MGHKVSPSSITEVMVSLVFFDLFLLYLSVKNANSLPSVLDKGGYEIVETLKRLDRYLLESISSITQFDN
jgi:hypothetical protein